MFCAGISCFLTVVNAFRISAMFLALSTFHKVCSNGCTLSLNEIYGYIIVNLYVLYVTQVFLPYAGNNEGKEQHVHLCSLILVYVAVSYNVQIL